MPRNVNLQVFKEPRAFIKILEIGIAIFAFSTTAGYYSEYKVNSMLVNQMCIDNKTYTSALYRIEGKFEYPFSDGMLYTSYLSGEPNCTGIDFIKEQSLAIAGKHTSESQFFVFTGVLSLLYCIFASIYYALENPSENMYSADVERCSFVVIDFLMSVLITVFWFAGSTAWAAGLPGLKDDTDPDAFIKTSKLCHGSLECEVDREPNYATLKVSVILGFLNLFVWLGNLWFLFKETPWHSPRREELRNDSLQ